MTQITAPEAQKTKSPTYRYFCELASNELDHEGVPESNLIVDVVVLENKLAEIIAAVEAASWLDGYMMMGYWLPSDCTEF